MVYMTGKRVLTIRQWDIMSCDVVVNFITACKRSLEQGNIFSSMCQEFCSQGWGVCLSACWDTTPPHGPGTPQTRHPTGPGTPQSRHPPDQAPPAQCMLGDTVNKRVVCILLECNLVFYIFSQKYKRSIHEFQRYTYHQSDIFSNTSMWQFL